MDNLEGRQDTVSGLYVRPTNPVPGFETPTLVYQHGTTDTKFGVPSRSSPGQDLPYLFATQGMAVLAPDFLNMGDDQEGFHPYVHARTEAMAAIQMRAALLSDPRYSALVNDQLFLTGYSQGGHASMALHEILIEEYPDIEVTAAAHLSGPYSLSDIMLNEVALSDEPFGYPAFMPYTLASYQAVYGNIYSDLSEVFRPTFVDPIQDFINGYETGAVGLSTLNAQLLVRLSASSNDSMTIALFDPDFVTDLQTNPNNTLLAALRDNDTYDFVNPTPTRLFYCTADDQVNFRNSIFAADTMTQLGAPDTEAIDVGPNLSHTACVVPAVSATVAFFAPFVTMVSGTGEIPGSADWTYIQEGKTLRIYTGSAERYQLWVMDATGRQLLEQTYTSGEAIDLGLCSTTWLAVQLRDENGGLASRSFVVR
jgi:hypothetical protein